MRHQFLRVIAGNGGGAPPVTPLLDDYPGAHFAFSLRNLDSDTINVVRLIRSSDSVESDFTAEEVADGTVATWAGAGDASVVTWYDQSGNARNATPVSASTRPRLVIDGSLVTSGGKPALDFVPTSALTAPGVADPPNPATIFAVTDTSDTKYILEYENSQNYGFVVEQGSTSTGVTTGTSTNELYANGSVAAITNRGTVYTALNGRKVRTAYHTSIRFSSYLIANYSGFVYVGKLQDYVHYVSDKRADRVGIEANINAHYAIF